RKSPPRPAPFSGPRLSPPPLFVVPGRPHRRIRLVGTSRRYTFVLEVNLGRSAQLLLEPPCTDQRRGPPHTVDVTNGLWNIKIALAGHLLENKLHGKERFEIGRADWLFGSRMQDRRQRFGEVGR